MIVDGLQFQVKGDGGVVLYRFLWYLNSHRHAPTPYNCSLLTTCPQGLVIMMVMAYMFWIRHQFGLTILITNPSNFIRLTKNNNICSVYLGTIMKIIICSQSSHLFYDNALTSLCILYFFNPEFPPAVYWKLYWLIKTIVRAYQCIAWPAHLVHKWISLRDNSLDTLDMVAWNLKMKQRLGPHTLVDQNTGYPWKTIHHYK